MLYKSLYIDASPGKGRGVFTSANIKAGTVIEIAPVIVMPGADRKHLDASLLHDYIFEWGHDRKSCAMALGYIPIYNHSYTSNCEYFMQFDDDSIFVKTVVRIKAGSELTINYNGDWDNAEKVWFEVS